MDSLQIEDGMTRVLQTIFPLAFPRSRLLGHNATTVGTELEKEPLDRIDSEFWSTSEQRSKTNTDDRKASGFRTQSNEGQPTRG